jgi:prepilin-type N-terminal cleavage/methylation domain-containing protein
MSLKYISKNSGFTLIEMIVSLGVFSIVVTTAVGALLMLISTNQQLQAEQSVMTNLSFALDTMTREIRTGLNYYCADSSGGDNFVFTNNNNHEVLASSTKDCVNGRMGSKQGISFFEGGSSLSQGSDRRILYYYDADLRTILRKLGNVDSESIVSSGLIIEDVQFYVTGSNKLKDGGDTDQPTVTVYIVATEKEDADSKRYYLQTTITQRILDL